MTPVIYPFDRLPIHPAPLPLETFTSYVLRLAYANGAQTLREFFAKSAPIRYQNRGIADLPPTAMNWLAQLTGHPEARLWETTFQPLFTKLNTKYTSSFLSESTSYQLRYCPQCLAEALYFRLPWRFLQLAGCPHHGCHLLDVCSHCRNPQPLWSSPMGMGQCPNCGEMLHTCHSSQMTSDKRKQVQTRFDDLRYLLTKQTWERDPGFAVMSIGPWLGFVRRQRHLLRVDLANQQGVSSDIFGHIERLLPHTQSSFAAYTAYIDALNLTWREVLEVVLERFRNRPVNVDQLWSDELLRRTEQAIQTLCDKQERVTYTAVARLAQVSPKTLHKNPDIVALIEPYEYAGTPSHWKQQRGAFLYEKTHALIQRLCEQNVPITQAAIEQGVGMGVRNLRLYPKVRTLIDVYTGKNSIPERRLAREAVLIQRAERIIAERWERDERITLTSVAHALGLGVTTITTGRYPSLKILIQEAGEKQRLHRFQVREDRLLEQVEVAIEQMTRDGELVTHETVATKLGMPRSSLATHPRVRQRLRQIPGRTHSAQHRRKLAQGT